MATAWVLQKPHPAQFKSSRRGESLITLRTQLVIIIHDDVSILHICFRQYGHRQHRLVETHFCLEKARHPIILLHIVLPPVTRWISVALGLWVRLPPPPRIRPEETASCPTSSSKPWGESACWSTPSWVRWPLTSGSVVYSTHSKRYLIWVTCVSAGVTVINKEPTEQLPNTGTQYI